MEMETEIFSTTFIAILIAFVFLYTLFSLLKPSNNVKLPPGPTPLPIIGSLHILGDLPHISIAELAKIHGPIMLLKLGSTTAVVFSTPETAKEVLQKQDLAFSTRCVPDVLHSNHHSEYSTFWLPVSNKWRSLRKILNTHMFSVDRLDVSKHLRARKIDEMFEYCRKSSESGETVEISHVGYSTAINVLTSMLFSTDLTDLYDGSDLKLKELVCDLMVETAKTNLVDVYPWLKRFDPQGLRKGMAAQSGKIIQMIAEVIRRRLANRKSEENDVNSNADVLDVCLNIARKNPDELDRVCMEHLFLDMIVAGSDLGSTVDWSMSELLRCPEKMKTAKLELKQVIGQGKTLNSSDIPKLPYLNCVMKEILRLYPAAPFLIPRKVETNEEVFDYFIPKGSQVFVNVYAMGRDPTIWEDPNSFKPERFLDLNVDVRGRDFEFTPFGSGRRMCPAIPLAMNLVPLIVGSLINCFDWKLEGGIEPQNLNMTGRLGISLQRALPLRAIPTLVTPES